jgi:hypothetical protein
VALSLFQYLKEHFKSPTVLEAWLKDDLSGLRLNLRKNGRFEMVVQTLFSEETFEGQYRLEGDKIIFLDRPYDNDFIPDTLTIWQDKLILTFEADGQPDLGFARYFQIQKNTIPPPPGATAPQASSSITFSSIREQDRVNWAACEAAVSTAERTAVGGKAQKALHVHL